MKIKSKLLLIMVIPFIGMFFFAMDNIESRREKINEAIFLKNAVNFSRLLSLIVNEVQIERGLSVGNISDEGNRFSEQLKQQRLQADSVIEAFEKQLKNQEFINIILGGNFNPKLNEFMVQLYRLEQHRARIDSLDMDYLETVENYSMITNSALNLVQSIAESGHSEIITKRLFAFSSILKIKEKAGLERALLVHVSTKDRYSRDELLRIVTNYSEQRFLWDLFRSFVTEKKRAEFNRLLLSEVNQAVSQLRNTILNSREGRNFDIDPELWFQVSSQFISRLHDLSQTVSLRLIQDTEFMLKTGERAIIETITVTAVIFVFSGLSVFFIIRSIVLPLNQAESIAIELSKGNQQVEFPKRKGKGETGQLLQSMETMVIGLQDKEREVQARRMEKEETMAQLEMANERLKSLDRLKDDFMANISHELKTPLVGMIGVAETLIVNEQNQADSESIDALKLIIKSGVRLSSLVNDILDFSNLRNRDLKLFRTGVHLKSCVQLCMDLSGATIRQKDLQLLNHVPDDFPKLFADENRLQQVLLNLIGNAIKFTENGSITVNAIQDGAWAKVSVIDTGMGIPKDQQQQIFQSFEHADDPRAHHAHGSGLGLSISKQLVELHGGQLIVESVPDQGSTFSFNLPLLEESQLIQGVKPAKASPDLELSKTLAKTENGDIESHHPQLEIKEDAALVLVVDDDSVNREVICNQLNSAGYRTNTAVDGLDALEQMGDVIPDIILLDLMMPRMNGFEFCREVRSEYDSNSLPIIMLTAKSLKEDMIAGLKLGANDYLTKPFHREELLVRVQNLLIVKENDTLKKARIKQLKTEQKLIGLKYRLINLLQAKDNAILFCNRKGRITFSNTLMESMLGYRSTDLMSKTLNEVIDLDSTPIFDKEEKLLPNIVELFDGHREFNLLTQSTSKIKVNISAFEFDSKGHTHFAIYFRSLAVDSGLPKKNLNSTVGEDQKKQLQILAEVCRTVEKLANSEGTSIVDCLLTLEDSLDDISLQVSKEFHPAKLRQDAVKVMNMALECWEEQTATSKLELAEQSGIWKVYRDHDQFRTRTLDKYLKIENLPKNPRWKNIFGTVDFVLKTNPKQKQELSLAVSQLKQELEFHEQFF